MTGLGSGYQLTIGAIARRARDLAPLKPIVARQADGSIIRTNWRELLVRAARLAGSLESIGVREGRPVGTLCWNSREHLEAYFGIPGMGAVLHTLNARAGEDALRYMLRDADTRILIVDEGLLPTARAFLEQGLLDTLIVTSSDAEGDYVPYEQLVADGAPEADLDRYADESAACALCHTTGTTGAPKGAIYSHRSLAIQSLGLMSADLNGIRERDVVLVVVPMFHANAWGHPYAAALAGSSVVLPHRDLSPDSLLTLIERERVTHTGGVSSVWGPVLERLDERPRSYDVSSLEVLRFGGMRAPLWMMRGFEERHGVPVVHGFGMTELGPMGGMSMLTGDFDDATSEERWNQRAKQGRPVPFLEVRARDDSGGLVPWDGNTPGELEVRGPSVISSYLGGVGADSFTADGWLRTGDIVTIDARGYIDIRDRLKDLIKSGGEWISSLDLELALKEIPEVEDAAVIAIPDERWQERPLAYLVWADNATDLAEPERISLVREALAEKVPSWWLPKEYRFTDRMPRTAVGKVTKGVLRDRYESEG